MYLKIWRLSLLHGASTNEGRFFTLRLNMYSLLNKEKEKTEDGFYL